jgi:hypothetical protein
VHADHGCWQSGRQRDWWDAARVPCSRRYNMSYRHRLFCRHRPSAEPGRFDRKRACPGTVFPDVCQFEAILDDLNCRSVERNQGIGMCRKSKRSDQSVGEKREGLRHRCSRHAAKPDKLLGSTRDSCRLFGPQHMSRRPVCMPIWCVPDATPCIEMGIMAFKENPSSPASDIDIRERPP